jgi:hypothetical protein
LDSSFRSREREGEREREEQGASSNKREGAFFAATMAIASMWEKRKRKKGSYETGG